MGAAAAASAAASRAGHRHRDPRPAAHGLEDVLRLRQRWRRGCPQRADLPRLPRAARARCPVLNREAVRHVLATGLAIEASIPPSTPAGTARTTSTRTCPRATRSASTSCRWHRPGGSASRRHDGAVDVGITRAHLEEDTARLIHTRLDGPPVSLLDFDRSGAPLLEIVSDPVIHDAETARRYAEELRLLLVTIGASDAAMESGQMRVEANVSLRPFGSEAFGTRVEVKNMNSFRSVERAIEFEIGRQAAALAGGHAAHPGDARLGRRARRSPITCGPRRPRTTTATSPSRTCRRCAWSPAWLEEIGRSMPELPAARRRRYRDELGLSAYDADVLVGDLAATALFESARAADASLSPKKLANWVTGESMRLAKGEGSDTATAGPERPVAGDGVSGVSGVQLAALVRMVEEGTVSGTSAKSILAQHARTGRPVAELVAEAGVQQISDAGALRAVVAEVLAENPAAVADVRAGVEKAYGFLTGQVMRRTAGRADASLVTRLLRESLAEGPAAEAAAPVSGDAG